MLAVAAANVNGQGTTTAKNDGGVYLRVGVGYAFPKGGSNLMTGTSFYTVSGSPILSVGGTHFNGNITEGTSSAGATYAYDIQKGSLSAGFGATLAAGYMFNPHIGVELGVGLGIAMKKHEFIYSSPASMGNYTETMTSYAKMPVLVMPSLVFSTGHNQIEGYARVGLALAVAGKTVVEYEFRDNGTNDVLNTMFEMKNKLALGLQGAAGVKYHVSDMIGIYLEATGLAMSLTPKTGEFTEFTINGADELTGLETIEREYEFNNEFTSNPAPASSNPSQRTVVNTPFSNLGLGLGVTFRF